MANIYFITQGCAANIADSETMQGILAEHGHEIVHDVKQADIVIFNTCTVKGKTEATFKRKLDELKKQNKKVIIAGCIPQSQLKDYQEFTRVGTFQIKKVIDAVNQTLKGKIVSYLERNDEGRLNIPKIRKNDLIEIVPISQGCLNACTFCKTKHARGDLKSYEIKDIVRHVSKAVEDGAKEIWLTSQDNAAYGFDINTNLANLLKEILTIDRDFKIRLGMGNPQHFIDYLDDLIKAMKDKRVFKFLHIPMQAGSNKVLNDMNRGYKIDVFRKVVKKLRKEIPDISIETDIIVGFPTETEDDFNETLNEIKSNELDMINYSRYWPRPGTPAARMKQINGGIIRDRIVELVKVFHDVAEKHNKQFLNKKETILITEKGKNGSFIGKNNNYKQVIVKGNAKIGKEVNVKIKSVTALDLRAEITQ